MNVYNLKLMYESDAKLCFKPEIKNHGFVWGCIEPEWAWPSSNYTKRLKLALKVLYSNGRSTLLWLKLLIELERQKDWLLFDCWQREWCTRPHTSHYLLALFPLTSFSLYPRHKIGSISCGDIKPTPFFDGFFYTLTYSLKSNGIHEWKNRQR